MSSKLTSELGQGPPTVYHIRIKGHLGRQWTGWFDGLIITLEDNGDTLLTGPVVDQAALHGLLNWVRNLGIPLLSVNQFQTSPVLVVRPLQGKEETNENE